MDKLSQLVKPLAKWAVIIGIVLLALSAVGGYFLSRTVVPKPKVGVVYFVGNIGGIDVAQSRAWFDYVHRHPEIRALVLIIDSPGGGAASGEEIYYQVRAMRDEMPVVAVIDQLGASAAYRIALGSNHIYAKPSSLVGSVGTAFQLPSGNPISEQAYTTGPHKRTGSSTELYIEKLGLLHEEFVNSVIAERGERLKMDRLPLSTGAVFIGLEALEYGLVDEIGSSSEAIKKAASLAGLRSYEVIDIDEESEKEAQAEELSMTEASLDVEYGSDAQWPVFYHLYFEME